MQCPRCHTAELVERDRTGVSIDICTSCRGVWLDRGELEKLIAIARDDGDGDDDDSRHNGRRRQDDDDDDDDDRRGRKGKRSWWDIFD